MLRMRLKLAASGSKSSVGRTSRSASSRSSTSTRSSHPEREHRVDFVVLESRGFRGSNTGRDRQEFFQLRIAVAAASESAAAACLRPESSPCPALRGAARTDLSNPIGISPTRKQPRSVSSLSAIDNNLPRQSARNRVFHADRFVVVVDGRRHLFGFALRSRIEAADDALQFREFFDQFGSQIGLRQAVTRAPLSALGLQCLRPRRFRQLHIAAGQHQLFHALGLIADKLPSFAWNVTFARSCTRSASFFF